MRHEEPDFVKKWRYIPAPRCCHTCDWYDKQGICQFHKSEPPKEFAETINACATWIEEIPF